MTLNRPVIDDDKVQQINQILQEQPGLNRSGLSKYLCEIWDWRSPSGQLKDMSCRDMLRALDKAGRIVLPPPAMRNTHANERRTIQHLRHDTTPVECKLKDLLPLSVVTVDKSDLAEFRSLIDQYHYLGFDRTVGENMKYIVKSRDGVVLACLLFGSAAWSCKDRDNYIGWNTQQRTQNLPLLTNNTRFLILPWIRSKYLASHILSLIVKRISDDWKHKYGHPLLMIETFVEVRRFKGSCYRAANWIRVGHTAGRGRDDRYSTAALPIKDIYLYPLAKDSVKLLNNPSH